MSLTYSLAQPILFFFGALLGALMFGDPYNVRDMKSNNKDHFQCHCKKKPLPCELLYKLLSDLQAYKTSSHTYIMCLLGIVLLIA